ncbi:MAG: hypothetical protein IPM64_09420 [Phycisphaerales bacterium]|nr:hypothetical protein [Phycisphaerales bacterium]
MTSPRTTSPRTTSPRTTSIPHDITSHDITPHNPTPYDTGASTLSAPQGRRAVATGGAPPGASRAKRNPWNSSAQRACPEGAEEVLHVTRLDVRFQRPSGA